MELRQVRMAWLLIPKWLDIVLQGLGIHQEYESWLSSKYQSSVFMALMVTTQGLDTRHGADQGGNHLVMSTDLDLRRTITQGLSQYHSI